MLITGQSNTHNHFSDFKKSKGSVSMGPDTSYGAVTDLIDSFSSRELVKRQKRLDRAIDELGVQFLAGSSTKRSLNPWRLDLFPLSLGVDEWRKIEKGVVQRALAFNAYAADLYGAQSALHARMIPHAVALRDPAFIRQLSGIPVAGGEYSQFGAFDLVCAGEGNWRVLEHHMGTPFGVSHVLQNRRILSQIFPELYERVDVAPVAGFSTYLLEMLRAQSKRDNPHVLLLTSGQQEQAYFEESFIARHMGISIAQPKDLLVRESRVYLKTVRGLEPVDVIYRRVESSSLDPIAVSNTGFGGVPGLINVLRKGNVAIVNSPGAGVSDNRALLRYSDTITRYYLDQQPIIKSVDTFHLDDIDQQAHVSDISDELALKPIQDHDILWRHAGGKRPKNSTEMARIAKKYPEYFVAQSIPEMSMVPRFKDGKFEAHAAYLRVFYILGTEPIVLPGGLARLGSPQTRTRRLTIVTDGLKDVWVPDSIVEDSAPKRKPMPTGARYSIGSRVAESLYWAGRYLERAENTARQFNTLEKLRWDQMAHSEQRTYWPLLQAVAAATGQHKVAKQKRPSRDTFQFSRSLLLDPKTNASVLSCVTSARSSLENVREMISPECREVVEELMLYLKAEGKTRINRSRLCQISEAVVSEVARFNGTAERTMPHDDSWQFFRIGVFFERAIGALSLLEVALPRIVQIYRAKDEEDADLTALLRLLGSLDAYRREFRSRAYVDRVARILIVGYSNPSSVAFSLRNLQYAISTLTIQGERKVGKHLLELVSDTLNLLETFSLVKAGHPQVDLLDVGLMEEMVAKFKPTQIAKELKDLVEQVEKLHERIEDVFFSHQDVFARDPDLFD
jgi:uncharacterized circularly permuted ATP-grasp superfamily protein/uncharacterized alpha-E superfamily protein